MIKPKVLIFSGYGLNCEEETKYAFDLAGGESKIVHINDCIENKKILSNFQIIVFPGGFSYGDDTGSGNAFANKIKNHLWPEILNLVKQDKLFLGICNGFQIMVNIGLLPATNNNFGKREVALINNNNARYTVRWVDVKVLGNSVWLKGLNQLSLPIAHGEGKFFTNKKTMKLLENNNQIVLKYIKGKICEDQNLDYNPNGSLNDVAGLTDKTGRILGLMPHPERAVSFTQLPNWTYLKQKYIKENIKIPTKGEGYLIFKNAIKYF